MAAGNAHRILNTLLGAFSDQGAGHVALTASADGTPMKEEPWLQFVVPTWVAATNILILPAPKPGRIVIIAGVATGGELRSNSPTTVAINGGTGAAAESAIGADEMVVAICESATSWKAFTLASDGTIAAAEAAA